MAFATYCRVSMMMLLALLMLAAATLARFEGDDHATLPIQSLTSSEGSASAMPEGLVGRMSPCAFNCATMCLGRKVSPLKFSLGKIWRKIHFRQAICFSNCMAECTIAQPNVKPELYHCALGCAYMSAAETTLAGSDGRTAENNCYNKCEESHQG